jgi:phosphonate transport system substrate-binding protein
MVATVRVPIIRFGMVSMGDSDKVRAEFRKLCGDIGYFLGTSCETVFATDYDALAKLVSHAQVDVAWLPPLVALQARQQGWADPMLAMVRRGETHYHSALFVRDDSPVHSVADLKSMRAAWVSSDSASGYLVPRSTLHTVGVRLRHAFVEERFVGSHANVVQEVWDKRADVGAGFVHVESSSPNDHDVRSASWMETDVHGSFRVLSLAGPIPTDSIVLHRSLYDELCSTIQESFSHLTTKQQTLSTLFACDDLKPCEPSFADGLERLIRLGDTPRRPSWG